MASAVLRVRDENGNVTDITSIKGADGKSAYQYAVEGGYKKPENIFYDDLSKVGNTSTRSTDSLEVFENDKHIGLWSDSYDAFGRFYLVDNDSRIPVGAQIASVEIAFLPDKDTGEYINGGEYINIKDMYTFDTSPYVILSDKVFYNPEYESLTYAYLLFFSTELNTLLTKAIDYGWSKIRITYYTD